MESECTVTAPGLDEALEQAAQQLGVAADELSYETTTLDDGEVELRAWIEEESDSEQPASESDDGASTAEEDDEDEVSDEELDHIADTAIDFLRDVLGYFGAENAEIDEYEGDEGELILDIVGDGDDLAILIGRYGKTLQALQQLTTSVVNRRLGYRYPVVVDVEGYKSRRRDKIEQIAQSAAERAIRKHSDVKLHPMTPYERRLVHIALRENPKVETYSEGEGPQRRVVVHPL